MVSVNAVNNIEDATAGSKPNFSSMIGTEAPIMPANIRFPSMAKNTTTPNIAE